MKRIENFLPSRFQVISIVLLIVLNAQNLYAEHDTSLRTDLNFNYTINEKFQAVSYVFFQVNDDISDFNYTELGIGLQYQTPATWLSFLVWYQQGYSKDNNNHWSLEQKPSINVNTSASLYHFKVSNQIRYEYRITPDWNDYRIKNTLSISRPDIFLCPYVGWELFYENQDRAVMLNRIKFGIVKTIDDHISIGPYYRIDFSNVNSRWEFTRQLIGFQVTFAY